MLDGDEACIEFFFFTRMLPVFRRIAVSFADLGISEQDVLQEAFVLMCRKNWQALRDFRFDCSLKTLVAHCVTRLLVKKSIKRKRMVFVEPPADDAEYDPISQLPDPSTQPLSDHAMAVKEAFMQLDREQRNMLLMRASGWSSKEVAVRLHTTPANIDVRVKRARDVMNRFIFDNTTAV